MKNYILVLFSVLSFLITSCSEKSKDQGTLVPRDTVSKESNNSIDETIAVQKKHDLYVYPELSYFLYTDDVQATKKIVTSVGGKVVYDPNFGVGSDIKFLIVTLPPEKLSDLDFSKALLNLNVSISLDSKYFNQKKLIDVVSAPEEVVFNSVTVPINDVKLDELRKRFESQPHKAEGEGIVVAVIDTGIDASHPVFQDRVVYWADQTQETRTVLKEQKADANSNTVAGYIVPSLIQGFDTYKVGEINEAAFRSQIEELEKVEGIEGLDINRNQVHTDKFFVLVGSVENQLVAYVDTNQDGKFSEKEIEMPLVDFNDFKNKKLSLNASGFVQFPSRNKTIKYPFLIGKDETGNPTHIDLGIDFHGHGTHVAGIIGGNGNEIKGAAPKVKFLAQKVCSGINCTDAAILRGLVDAFYNPQGLVPHIVNISLGSHQTYQQEPLDHLLRDLAAKFGTTFFISASNSGPGYRSLNHFGSFGPTIQVAAHVSRNTIDSHYNLNKGDFVPENNLLFFTSLGPSFTGQMRPNIAAPGSALSATPLINEKSAMWNGTSMSSPLAAGATAALLSVAQHAPEMEYVLKKRADKLNNLKVGSDTLMGIPLMIRESLENSATRMDQYTMASQGYGLINVNAAYDELLRISSRVNQTGFNHFDLKLNANDKNRKFYDRSLRLLPGMPMEIDIETDGEASEESILKFQNTPIRVRLEKVEIQDTDGSVVTVTENLPFGISLTGIEQELFREVDIRVTTAAQKVFTSVRDLKNMAPGKTYVAHYSLSQNGYRIMSALDVVHMPIFFENKMQRVEAPSLGLKFDNILGPYLKKGVEIKAMAQHRYPVAITENETVLNISFYFSPENSGRLNLKVYNPDGKEVSNAVLLRNINNVSGDIDLAIPTLDSEKGTVRTGVYEVVIHSANGRGISNSKYDLLMHTTRVVPSVKRLDLVSSESKNFGFKMINVDQGKPTVSATALVPTYRLKDVPVKANYWTFRKLNFEWAGRQTLEVMYDSESEQLKTGNGYFGRIDNVLYTQNAAGDFVPTDYRVTGQTLSGDSVVFKQVNYSKDQPLFVALENFEVAPQNGTQVGIVNKLNLLVKLNDLAEQELEVKTSPLLNGMHDVQVTAPKFEAIVTPVNVDSLLTSDLTLRVNESVIEIPVTVGPK